MPPRVAQLLALAFLLGGVACAFSPNIAFIGKSTSSAARRQPLFAHTAAFGFGFPDDLPGENSHPSGISSSELRRVSEARRRRLQEEEESKSRFVSGDELHELRRNVMQLRQQLADARQHPAAAEHVRQLENAILQAQQLDAEFIYEVALERAQVAEQSGDQAEAKKLRAEAQQARRALPHFNLDGLWVGRYGDEGFQMINVTYVEDTLIATKVTDDKNVPKGEMSFSVDLSPFALSNNLEPIELGREASQQWGCKFLPRFSGNGQVANEGFVNSQVVEGQLIMVGQYFSFAWLPIQHQVFFGRPSAELTLKLLRESRGAQGHSAQWREHLARCLQETEHLEDELEVHGQFFRSHNQQDYYSLDGCFE